ncbi:MAG: Ig-like domain repeat protein [Methanosphaera sp.]|nr:Ig-like domain repeat protein [Methanosphaera sp.]
MNKQTIKKLFLLLILTVLLIGIASATDTNNKTNTNKNTIEKSLQNTQTQPDTKEINKHTTTTNTKTSTKKTPTKLTIKKIKTVEFSDKTLITGTYKTSKGKPLKNTVITLNINGKQYKTKTYSSGNYFYKYQTNKVGTNKVTATYPGNSKYKAATTKTTFKVTKKGTRVKLNYIPPTEYTDKVTITGKFTNNKAKALMSATIILKINGKKYATKTNAKGEFKYKYTTNRVGRNNITAYFRGNDYYKYNSTKKTFKVDKKFSSLTLTAEENNENTPYDYISGSITDDNDKSIGIATINLKINGKKYAIKTNKYGNYNFKYYTKKIGLNTIEASYSGNKNYLPSSCQTTFYVEGKPTNITVSDTITTQDHKYIKIRGRIYDDKGYMAKYVPLKIIVDGETQKIKTDNDGLFICYIKNNNIYKHHLTITIEENSRYNKNTEELSFITRSQSGTLEVPLPLLSDTEYEEDENDKIGTDVYYSWYQLEDGQGPAGAYVSLFGKEGIDDIPANKITSVIFYFRNDNNGRITTVKGNDELEDDFRADKIPGYTAYKAIVNYRQRTSQEIRDEYAIREQYATYERSGG